jgi:hypothetical protein
MNTATSERLMDTTVKPTPGCPPARPPWPASLLQVAHDVLQDDDGVVHDEACRDGERHEREVVQAVACEMDHPERADER